MRIHSRKEWGAQHDNGTGYVRPPFSSLWLHHSVTEARNGAAGIRALERVGEMRFGSGISYTWIITPDGTVYEGHSVDREGTHTYGYNRTGRAICLLGNYSERKPSEQQIQSIVELIRYVKSKGWCTSAKLRGHRDTKQTECPGNHAYAMIPRINELVSQPINAPEEDDMKIFLCKDKMNPSRGIHAVTPVGHWRIPNEQALKDFCHKWGLKTTDVQENANTRWWGPDLGSA